MCGIAGAFAKNSTVEKQWLSGKVKLMLSRISHRGFSSSSKIDSSENCSLGCVRLPIVDEVHGNQPVLSENGRIILAFNGEIYNHNILRQQYLSGKKCKTSCDTEVLANLIADYGITTTLPLLEGMFAFIAYDLVEHFFIIARDFIGIKPIYFSADKSSFFAASEIKAFDKNIECINELPPQHYFDSRSGLNKWEAPVSNTAETLREQISKSVKEQVNTHLPIAVFLSGGIDSSIICYEANQHHSDVTAFAIGKKDSDDMIKARQFCNDFKFRFAPVVVNESEILNSVEETIYSIESFEPNLIRAGALAFMLSRHVASKGFRIALCGEGADELFGGYPDFIDILRKSNNDYLKLGSIMSTFMAELYLSQLRRVDRTGMRFSLEVRPPLLSSQIVSYANSLPPQSKLVHKNGEYITKHPLREAYRDILPSYIVDRIKSVFSEGAGFDTNGHHGPFWEYTKHKVSQPEIKDIQNTYKEYSLKTHEEVYYFKIFMKYFNVTQIKSQRLFVSAV